MKNLWTGLIWLFLIPLVVAQSTTEIAPGVRLTSDALVWLVENGTDKIQVSPLTHHDAEISSDLGANFARSTIFMKQKKPVVIAGSTATTRTRCSTPSLFVQLTAAEEKELLQSSPSDRMGYAIIRLDRGDTRRRVGGFEFSRFKGKATFVQDIVPTRQERFGTSDWLQVTPTKTLAPGEYALVQILPRKDVYSPWIFDFGVD